VPFHQQEYLHSRQGGACRVRGFRQEFTLDDAVGSHACSLVANMRVTNDVPLGRPLPLTVATVNSVQMLKATATRLQL
jgi:hypothetical protein